MLQLTCLIRLVQDGVEYPEYKWSCYPNLINSDLNDIVMSFVLGLNSVTQSPLDSRHGGTFGDESRFSES